MIFQWHIAATVVFLLVGLQPLEHFRPFLVLQGLFVVRALVAGHYIGAQGNKQP